VEGRLIEVTADNRGLAIEGNFQTLEHSSHFCVEWLSDADLVMSQHGGSFCRTRTVSTRQETDVIVFRRTPQAA
jgi:hypothetical protein